MTPGLRLRIAALLQAALVAAVAVGIGDSWWLALVVIPTFGITWAGGTVIDQGVAAMILVLPCFAMTVLAYQVPRLSIQWSLPAGAAFGLATGWATSAILDWKFGLRIRRLGG